VDTDNLEAYLVSSTTRAAVSVRIDKSCFDRELGVTATKTCNCFLAKPAYLCRSLGSTSLSLCATRAQSQVSDEFTCRSAVFTIGGPPWRNEAHVEQIRSILTSLRGPVGQTRAG